MSRETKIIETPAGNKVEIKTFFTQFERAKVQRILAGDSVVKDGVDTEPKVSDLLEAQKLAVEIAVVSFNDDTNAPAEKIMNELPASEFDAVAIPVLELVKPDLAQAK